MTFLTFELLFPLLPVHNILCAISQANLLCGPFRKNLINRLQYCCYFYSMYRLNDYGCRCFLTLQKVVKNVLKL